MTEPIPISFVVEDELSEAIARHLLCLRRGHFFLGTCYRKRGRSYIEKSIAGFNQAARGTPFLVLADLDRDECAPLLVNNWLPHGVHHNLLLRIAVKVVESWLLGDRNGVATLLGIRRTQIPAYVDEIDNPKEFLIFLARRSRYRSIREDIVPRTGSTAKIGPGYNSRLIRFVRDKWDVAAASGRSKSLRSTVRSILHFQPTWATEAN